MVEYYDILWAKEEDNVQIIGEMLYDLEKDKFCAELKDGVKEFPTLLFGIFAQGKVADDRKVRDYISSCVISKSVPNLEQALEWMGFKEYNQWEIYKYNYGKNNNDKARIRLRETK